jgi:hypothetical protein
MKVLFLGILLLTLSQASWANFQCDNESKMITVVHTGNQATVDYQTEGQSLVFEGQWTLQRDFLYTTYTYTLNDTEGKPVSLIITKQRSIGRGGIPIDPIYYTFAKLKYGDQQQVMGCF